MTINVCRCALASLHCNNNNNNNNTEYRIIVQNMNNVITFYIIIIIEFCMHAYLGCTVLLALFSV